MLVLENLAINGAESHLQGRGAIDDRFCNTDLLRILR
jgi:hypothetical protein